MAASWRNWSGTVRCEPGQVLRVPDEGALRAVLPTLGRGIRPAGAGHSFMPLVGTDGVIVDVSALKGIRGVTGTTATVGAGTVLRELTHALAARGLALPNQGDVDRQTIAGATATGTHGTGASLPCVTAAVSGLTLVTVDGQLLRCDAEHDGELFDFARLSLGLLGVITELQLACVSAYGLEEQVEVRSIAEGLAALLDRAARVRHIELFVFPAIDIALVKQLTPSTRPGGISSMASGLLDDVFLWTTAPVVSTRAGRSYQRAMLKGLAAQRRHGPSHLIFPTERRARFEEMEYVVPRDRGVACAEAIIALMARDFPEVPIPVELRLVARDDIPLSPFQEDAMTIAVHHRPGARWQELFAAVEPVLVAAGGRPHWGKRHTRTRRELLELYPRLPRFLALRKELDPAGRLLTPALAALFEGP